MRVSRECAMPELVLSTWRLTENNSGHLVWGLGFLRVRRFEIALGSSIYALCVFLDGWSQGICKCKKFSGRKTITQGRSSKFKNQRNSARQRHS
ncbi:hypothetical protein LY78DRAFT_291577 [Colletotrichum sublineola]|nr:hypothetical protein LY78DRAFT_291577 [Colletotrichum sublineola]